MIKFKTSLKQFPGGTYFFNVPKHLIKSSNHEKGDSFHIIMSKNSKEINDSQNKSIKYKIFFKGDEIHGYPVFEDEESLQIASELNSNQLKGGQEIK